MDNGHISSDKIVRSLPKSPRRNVSREMLYNALMLPDDIRKNVGKGGEEIAYVFLVKKGYRVIEKNYRRKWGEIDIIAEKDGTVRFIEVKTVSRESRDYRPEELVHRTKLRKVARTAALYMEEHHDEREFQIDAVGVILNERERIARCRLFEQALEDNL